MTNAERTLSLDLGSVGELGSQRFTVALDAAPFERLLDDARNAHRIYELALLQRPGDLWDYLEVIPTQVPPAIADHLKKARSVATNTGAPWPEGRVPFAAFDNQVRDGADEAAAAAEAWRDACAGEEAQAFVRQLFGRIPDRRIAPGTGLVGHEEARIAAGTHPYTFLPREQAMAASRRHAPNAPAHTEAFYAKLDELVGDAEVGSVFVRGLGDHRLLRLLCERQRAREDFEISVLTEREVNNEAWGAQIAYYTEDIGQGFLFVEDGAAEGPTVKDLVEVYATLGPGGLILSSQDEGKIPGFAHEHGDGWHLYRSEVTPHMLPRLRKYHSVWALMLAQENGELSDAQVVEIIAQWENFLSKRFPAREG
ncbi:hypothetical protein BWI17_15515 [Betaproteobacteria bacterium GR16-43]|nr:hypothetical protein BWI17_15515 [Betaproteobacteria bacterium GR16-43]